MANVRAIMDMFGVDPEVSLPYTVERQVVAALSQVSQRPAIYVAYGVDGMGQRIACAFSDMKQVRECTADLGGVFDVLVLYGVSMADVTFAQNVS